MTRLGQSLSVSGLIVFGTTTSLFAKVVYELQSVGIDGQQKYFRKPWAMTSVMFLGMSLCLPYAYYLEAQQKKRRKQQAQEAGINGVEEPLLPSMHHQRSEFKEVLMLAIPTVFDLLATVLMNVGLLSVTASVYQMMRGAEMLFAATFAVAFLHRKLNRYHLGGIACCILGITLVGSSSLLSGEGSATQVVSKEQMLLGMGLIILSQAVQAAQLTFEDFFMADLDIPGVKIVGYEGLLGALMTLGIMMPIAYYLPGPEGEGIHEDALDTLAMVRNSRALQVILAVDMAALLLYNVSGMAVTGHLGAVFRTVLETMRTLFVWLVDLALFYTPLGMGQVGESWSRYSWLQAAGFVVLVTGTLVYRRGDEAEARQELAEALALRAADAPMPMPHEHGPGMHDGAIGGPQLGSPTFTLPVPGADGSTSRPIAMPVPVPVASSPMDMKGSSFRATQTIAAGSYSRSLTRGGGSYMGRAHLQQPHLPQE